MPESPGLQPLIRKASDDAIPTVYRRARRLAKLKGALIRALEPEEGAHLLGVSATGPRLVVFADSSAWATRLRYRAPALETAAQAHIGATPQLVFRTLPARVSHPAPARVALSPRARATLASAARTISDPELAAALLRLAGD